MRGLKENVIIGRLIPAGTGFNTYEEPSAIEDYSTDLSSSVLDEVDDPMDMVLDDRTARAYNLDSPSLSESGFIPTTIESSILGGDDELIPPEIQDLREDRQDNSDFQDGSNFNLGDFSS